MKNSTILLLVILAIIVIIMCYNLIIINEETKKNIENFSNNKLNKFKKKNKSNHEKFKNLGKKNNRKRDREEFDDINFSSSNNGLLDRAYKIFSRNNKKKTSNGVSLDDIINRSEKIEREITKISASNLKKEAFDYYNSFKKEKFKANVNSTAEALDKFKLFKEKFFEIFD